MTFRLPTYVEMGRGTRASLADLLRRRGLERPAIMLDPGIETIPVIADFVGSLAAAFPGAEDYFTAIEPNPRTSTAERAAEFLRLRGADAVIGIGGGSTLDAAKAAAMLATNPGSARDFTGPNKFTSAPLSSALVPTTCGTGSEVTWVSVLSDVDKGEKISVKGDGMFPDMAISDADLIDSLPAHQVAWTGMDAMTHAVEAIIVRCHNPASDALAAEAVRLILGSIEAAVAGDAAAREQMMTASTLAGMAFGSSDVGAVHCLSESLGGRFDLAHGLLNAVLLVPVLRYQEAAARDRLELLANLTGTAGGASGMLKTLAGLSERLEIPNFATLGVPENAYPDIARMSVTNGSNPSNPMELGEADYLTILENVTG